MGLTRYVLEEMGYQAIDPERPIVTKLFQMSVYSIRGLVSTVEHSLDPTVLTRCFGNVSFAIADSVNDASLQLIDEVWDDDEAAWMEKWKASKPFLAIRVEDPTFHTAINGWHCIGDHSEIQTYDTFSTQRNALREIAGPTMSELVSALSIALSGQGRPVTLHHIQTEILGITPEGRRHFDIRLDWRVEAYGARGAPEDQLLASIDRALAIQQTLPPNVGVFYDLAIQEKDPLKKFLYQFYALEIYTKATFATLASFPVEGFDPRLTYAFTQIDQTKGWKRWLKQNFIWCARQVWESIDDSDFRQFELCKDLRDQISHGQRVKESELPTHGLGELLRKVLAHG